MFKAGDVVKRKDCTTFSNGSVTITVDKVTDAFGEGTVWLRETGSWVRHDKLALVKSADPTLEAMKKKLSELELQARDLQTALDKKKDDVDAIKAAIKIWEVL